ncbi:MAG: hypothetical protein ACKO7B_21725, partial [Flavobacteriales bacterium]
MKRIALLLVFAIAMFGSAFAQKQISEQEHAWLMYFGNHRITDCWGLHTEYQWRRADGFEH